jgi:membrane protease YdiL (CAAX protease family)
MDEAQRAAAPRWGKWRVLLYALFVSGSFVLAQAIAIFAVTLFKAATEPGFDAETWAGKIENDGVAFPLCAIAGAAVCIPLMRFLAGRREPEPWSFLGLRAYPWRSTLLWCGAMLAFIVLQDSLSVALGRPIVPAFMAEVYSSARSQLLLLLALVVAAPLTEELFFRGFLLSAFQSLGIPFRAGAVVTSIGWALIHSQYDAYDITIIFVMGLLLAEARLRAGSIMPCIAMHSFGNLVAYLETAYFAAPALAAQNPL